MPCLKALRVETWLNVHPTVWPTKPQPSVAHPSAAHAEEKGALRDPVGITTAVPARSTSPAPRAAHPAKLPTIPLLNHLRTENVPWAAFLIPLATTAALPLADNAAVSVAINAQAEMCSAALAKSTTHAPCPSLRAKHLEAVLLQHIHHLCLESAPTEASLMPPE